MNFTRGTATLNDLPAKRVTQGHAPFSPDPLAVAHHGVARRAGSHVGPGAPAPKPQAPVEEDLGITAQDRPTFDRTPPALQVEVSDQIDSTSTELLRRAPRRDIHGAAVSYTHLTLPTSDLV